MADTAASPRFMRPVEVWSKDATSYCNFAIDFWPVLAPFARRLILLGRLAEHLSPDRKPTEDTATVVTDAEVLAWLETAYPLDTWTWKA